MTLETAIDAEITFAAGIPGFPNARRFAMQAWGDDDSPFILLECLEDANLAFVIAAPWLFYPDYVIDIDDATVEKLGLRSAEDAGVYCIVTIGDEAKDSTLNLLGPIVVNRRSGSATQVVLHDSGYEVRAPITGA
ncbi:MAG: flagellar assembly protein FliW [Acidimicrobiia bacterium]